MKNLVVLVMLFLCAGTYASPQTRVLAIHDIEDLFDLDEKDIEELLQLPDRDSTPEESVLLVQYGGRHSSRCGCSSCCTMRRSLPQPQPPAQPKVITYRALTLDYHRNFDTWDEYQRVRNRVIEFTAPADASESEILHLGRAASRATGNPQYTHGVLLEETVQPQGGWGANPQTRLRTVEESIGDRGMRQYQERLQRSGSRYRHPFK